MSAGWSRQGRVEATGATRANPPCAATAKPCSRPSARSVPGSRKSVCKSHQPAKATASPRSRSPRSTSSAVRRFDAGETVMVDQRVHRTAVERVSREDQRGGAVSGHGRGFGEDAPSGSTGLLGGIGGGGLSLQEHHFNQEEQQGPGQSVRTTAAPHHRGPPRRPRVLDLGRDHVGVAPSRCDQGLTPGLRVERGELAL